MPRDCRDHRRSRKRCLRLSELIGPIGCRVAPGVQENVAADKVGGTEAANIELPWY